MVHCGHVTLGPELYHTAVQQNHKNVLSYLKVQEGNPQIVSILTIFNHTLVSETNSPINNQINLSEHSWSTDQKISFIVLQH